MASVRGRGLEVQVLLSEAALAHASVVLYIGSVVVEQRLDCGCNRCSLRVGEISRLVYVLPYTVRSFIDAISMATSAWLLLELLTLQHWRLLGQASVVVVRQ